MPLACFLAAGLGVTTFDVLSSTLLVLDVHPGIKTVPHALHAELDPSMLLGLGSPAPSMCRWSISCAEVAGTVTEYRCAEACRNLSLASAATSAMMRLTLSMKSDSIFRKKTVYERSTNSLEKDRDPKIFWKWV